MPKKRVLWALLGTVIVLAGIQAIPAGRDHTNPPVRGEPTWDSPVTRELVVRACYDCHSNETVWPWYSNIAPISWLVQRDVEQGRDELNFSEWDLSHGESHDIAEAVGEGEMPPSYYKVVQRKASLSSAEEESLKRGLEATSGMGR